MAKVFITGGTGCIGAVTVYQLITQYGDEIEQVLIASRSASSDQLEIWFGESLQRYVDEGRIAFARVDIGDQQSLQSTLEAFQPTHLIHLGALQSPDCASNPGKRFSREFGRDDESVQYDRGFGAPFKASRVRQFGSSVREACDVS